MKLPKHRANVYLVERHVIDEGRNSDNTLLYSCWKTTTVGVFNTLQGAEDFAGACAQEFRERGYDDDDYTFDVKLTAYYDQ